MSHTIGRGRYRGETYPSPAGGSFDPTPYLYQLAWFVNYATGSNANDGKTALTAVADLAEIRRRWNGGLLGVRPQLPSIAVTVTVTGSPALPFSDPVSVLCDIDAQPGFSMLIDFGATVKRSGHHHDGPEPFRAHGDRASRRSPTWASRTGRRTSTNRSSTRRRRGSRGWSRASVPGDAQRVAAGRGRRVDPYARRPCSSSKHGPERRGDRSRKQLPDPRAPERVLRDGRELPDSRRAALTRPRRASRRSRSTRTRCSREQRGRTARSNADGDVRAADAAGACILFPSASAHQSRSHERRRHWANCGAPTGNVINVGDILAGDLGAGLLAGYARGGRSHSVPGSGRDQDFAILGAFAYITNLHVPVGRPYHRRCFPIRDGCDGECLHLFTSSGNCASPRTTSDDRHLLRNDEAQPSSTWVGSAPRIGTGTS